MKFITSKDKAGKDLSIYYEEQGAGKPVILIHGWPVDHQMWDNQVTALTDAGFRCISYDRRGFGKSDKPADGYDYDSLADDLKALVDELKLEDFALVGFSMAGGEVVRYFSRHGGKGVSKAVLVSSIAPYMLQTDDNPDGVPQKIFDQIAAGIREERPAFLSNFIKQFYGVGLLSKPVSNELMANDLTIAMQATLKSTLCCAVSFSSTDLRDEMSTIHVPVLVIHGGADQTVPIKPTGQHAAQLIPNATYIVYENEPHGLFITSKDRLSTDLINFLKD
jgi:non-heme chloroperoxidase